MNMKRVILAILVAIAFQSAAAQAPPAPKPAPRSPLSGRLFFGGGVGASFGAVDYLELAPMVGFAVTPRFSVGGGLVYRWTHDTRYSSSLNTTDRGANAFARYRVVGPLFVQGEYETLSYEYVASSGGKTRDNQSSWLAGGGYARSMSGRASFYATMLYNFSYDANSSTQPYDSPWQFGAGVSFGF